MVRMRFQFPAPAPVTVPQRFPIGTRVANPIEGRTGHIDGFDSTSGVYHLVFNDGHQEDVSEVSVDRFVIRIPPPPPAVGEATRQAPNVEADDENENDDPHKLMGVAMLKTVRDYEGVETTIGGCVETYLPSSGYYRVVYENGLVEDMRPEQTRSVVAKATRKRTAHARGNEAKSEEDDPAEHLARKKQRVGLEETGHSRSPPLNTERLPSRMAAYEILRKVVRAILVQADVKPLRSEKQRLALSNDDIRPKKALEHFVDADGLKFLQKVLALWMKKTETHRGAMLVLKILAALPGVTAELVLASQIGKTLRRISKLSRQLEHVDPALGDLADWVIYTWQRDVVHKAGLTSAKALTSQQAAAVQGENQPQLYVLPATAELKIKQRAATTAHLRKLLTAEPEPPVKTTDEPAIFLANYNSLGSIDKRRPLRQIIHIESLVERVRKRHDDQAAKLTDDEGGDDDTSPSKATAAGPGSRRIRFRRRDEIIQFGIHVAPLKLLETDRSKIVDAMLRQRMDAIDDSDDDDKPSKLPPPNKRTAPVKPILKIRDEVVVPFSRIVWT